MRLFLGVRPVVLAALGTLTLPSALRGQTVINLPQNRAAFSEAEAEQVLREVTPFVEWVTQRRFKHAPRMKLMNREEYLALQAGRPDAPGAAQAVGTSSSHSSEITQTMSFAVAAFYRLEDKTLYLMPQNLTLLLSQTNRPFDDRILILRHFVAHELVHALQDQEVGLEKFMSGVWYLEETMARKSLVEGQATFVEDEVGKLLKDRIRFVDLERLIEPPADPRTNPTQAGIQNALKTIRARYYLGGSQFVAAFYRQGGMNRVWKLFEAPPSDMGMILHPERYLPTRPTIEDYSRVFDGFETQLGRRPWEVIGVQYGPWSIDVFQSGLSGLTLEERRALGDRVLTCRNSMARQADNSHTWSLALYELTDAESTPIVLELLNAARNRSSPPHKPGSAYRPATTGSSQGNGTPTEVSLPSSATSSWLASAKKGCYLLTFSGSYDGMTTESLTAALQNIMSRLPEAGPASRGSP